MLGRTFEINNDLLAAMDEYHEKTMLMERHVIEGIPYFHGNLEEAVDDDLIYHVPIYDMGSRKYAAFCSFTEALWRKENDVKGNGKYFKNHEIKNEIDWFMLFYLFRLCGSGINYVPKTDEHFLGTHGFGNFWIVHSILDGYHDSDSWLAILEHEDGPFTDNRGYMLPQFSYPNQKTNHLKRFILEESLHLVESIYDFCLKGRREIYQITDFGNQYLNDFGFKRQNFVLTAFAADLAEYFPNYVDPKGKVYAGTNALRCIKAIFPKKGRYKEFEYINDVLHFQSERYGLNPIDCEDSRNCDLVRYFQEYQSKDHIAHNRGKIMKNNSILKKKWGHEKYYKFAKELK